MPLTSPERPRQENAEAHVEASRKIDGGPRIVRLDEVAARREAAAQAEARTAELTEAAARADVAHAKELAGKFNNQALVSRLLAEAGPKEYVAQRAAAARESASEKATQARVFGELVKIEKDPAALDAWERTREQEAAKLNQDLKTNPENKQAKARLGQIKIELDTAMNIAGIKQEMLDWNRAQAPKPRVEAPRMAA